MRARIVLQLAGPGGSTLAAAPGDLARAQAEVATAVVAPEVEPARARVLAFLDRHPDALHRSCADGHLTGSAVVVDPSRGQALLLLHTKLGRWFQPGGHADGEGNLAAVALDEANEETGIDGLRLATPAIDLDIHLVPLPGEAPHLHLDVRYLAIAPPGADAPGNHESSIGVGSPRMICRASALTPAPSGWSGAA